MRLTKLLTLLGLLWSGMSVTAQNQYHISQYMIHQPFVNPASIGSYGQLTAAGFYKNQWTGFEGAPSFQGIFVSSPVGKGNSFLGFSFVNDQIGVNTNMDASGTFAYRVKPSKRTRLLFSLSASARMLQSNYSELSTEISDPLLQQNSPMIVQPNFKFGTYYYGRKFYIGFAVPNLLKNTIHFDGTYSGTTEFDFNNMHFFMNAGYKHKFNPDLELIPSVLLKQVSGSPFHLDINTTVVFKQKFGVGVSYRTSKEIAAILSYQIAEQFKMAYAYDFNFSELSTYSSGSHEIMLIYQMKKKNNKAIIEAPRY